MSPEITNCKTVGNGWKSWRNAYMCRLSLHGGKARLLAPSFLSEVTEHISHLLQWHLLNRSRTRLRTMLAIPWRGQNAGIVFRRFSVSGAELLTARAGSIWFRATPRKLEPARAAGKMTKTGSVCAGAGSSRTVLLRSNIPRTTAREGSKAQKLTN